MQNYDVVLNNPQKEKISLANGHISATTVLFEQQNVIAKIEAKGEIAFFDSFENMVATLSLPQETEGKQVYSSAVCSGNEKEICLEFPIVQWIDNYPHCDGEHDRWDEKIVGYYTVTYDCFTKTVTLT